MFHEDSNCSISNSAKDFINQNLSNSENGKVSTKPQQQQQQQPNHHHQQQQQQEQQNYHHQQQQQQQQQNHHHQQQQQREQQNHHHQQQQQQQQRNHHHQQQQQQQQQNHHHQQQQQREQQNHHHQQQQQQQQRNHHHQQQQQQQQGNHHHQQKQQQQQQIHKSYTIIPKFYFKLPKNNDFIGQKLREEARSLFLQKRTKELLDNNELKELWNILEKNHTQITSNGEQLINYDDYIKIKNLVINEKCYKYLTATLFAQLQNVSGYPGKVSIMSVFNYVMRKVWMQQTRIGLSLYDYTGQGYLRETDLENYIHELIPTLPQLEGLENSFHSFYVCTAVRKFFFFLDPLRTGKIRIRDILSCGFLDDLLELRGTNATNHNQNCIDDDNICDQSLSKIETQELNWFSATSALTVYGHYLNLDKDHNGMLSKNELRGYGSGTLTKVFIDRVFDECLTYDGEMDYKTYLDFVLALENRHEIQSLQYIFRILDIEHNGYLTSFTLQYFFKGIQEQINSHKAEPVNFDDVKDEIFDMVKSEDPTKITLKDLINCGQAETVVSILIEFHKFWAYENREAMVVETASDDIAHNV